MFLLDFVLKETSREPIMRNIALTAVVLIVGLGCTVQAVGASRDADGSRMQAREHKIGSTVSDRLAPPSDTVDWRYVRVAKAHDLALSLTSKPADKPVRLQVTNAVGKPIMEGATQKGQLSLSRRLDAGLYYVAVSSSGKAEYSLTIR